VQAVQSARWKFPLIAVVTALFLSCIFGFGITLGLDLKGGSVLIYELDTGGIKNKTPEITKDTIEILHRRLDTLGTKEMSIRQAGDYQIMIQLPGVGDQSKEQIKDLIARSGQLAFKIVVTRDDPRWEERIVRDIEERKARGVYLADEDEFDTARDGRTGETLLLQNDDSVPGKLLEGAHFTRDGYGAPAVAFSMKKSGTARLAHTTEKYKNHQMAIVLDGVAVSAPNIKNPITQGEGIIEGKFTQQEIENLITVLRSGALPAKPVLASENSVEPSLGQASIDRGMTATFIAIVLVVVFMFVYYRGSGAIANLALVLNIALLLGVMSLFDFTLTLPGIAGIVLTIGMAVDANILIYERMREEKRRQVPLREVIDAGYSHAFWAIFDSNITTVLTALILYYVGTGPIKGFAVTLAVGIACSMFTALFVTRALFDYLAEKGVLTDISMIQLRKEVSKIPFVRRGAPFTVAAVILLNVGYVSFVVRGDQKFGIDFNGGSAIQVRLRAPLTKEEIEARLAKVERAGPDGKVERPYADAEVTRLGEAETPQGAGRHFQVLVSEHGRVRPAPAGAGRETGLAPADVLGGTAHADDKPAAAASAVAPAGTGAAAPGAEGEGEEAHAPSALDVVIVDVGKVFEAELAPRAFAARAIETDAAQPGKSRVVVEARLSAPGKVSADDARKALEADGLADIQVAAGADGATLTLRSGLVDSEARAIDALERRMKGVLEEKFPDALSNPFPFKTSIGASVAESLKYRAVLAIVLSLLMIVGYLAFRFEFKMGLAAALCLFHDVLVTLGFMMLLDVTSPWTGIDAKQNLTTIAAYLTIVGFSINDTIVTFDRMRENLRKWDPKASGETYEGVLERSINETLSRTILTSFTVFLVILVLAFSGVKSIQGFTLAMLVGILFGTYSSIVVATPLLLVPIRRIALFCAAELAFFIVMGIVGSRLQL
jgi:SecD/SecF fusion protein